MATADRPLWKQFLKAGGNLGEQQKLHSTRHWACSRSGSGKGTDRNHFHFLLYPQVLLSDFGQGTHPFKASFLSEMAAKSHRAVVKINGVMQTLPKWTLCPSQENRQTSMFRSAKIMIITTKLRTALLTYLGKGFIYPVQFIIFLNNFTVLQAHIWIWSGCRITCQRAK